MACGRADHETWMNEMTASEWNWLEAYRSEYGLPEDRLRYYLAIMTSCITSAMSLSGQGMSTLKVLEMMDPYRERAESKSSEQPEIISPNQGAALFSATVNAARARRG